MLPLPPKDSRKFVYLQFKHVLCWGVTQMRKQSHATEIDKKHRVRQKLEGGLSSVCLCRAHWVLVNLRSMRMFTFSTPCGKQTIWRCNRRRTLVTIMFSAFCAELAPTKVRNNGGSKTTSAALFFQRFSSLITLRFSIEIRFGIVCLHYLLTHNHRLHIDTCWDKFPTPTYQNLVDRTSRRL